MTKPTTHEFTIKIKVLCFDWQYQRVKQIIRTRILNLFGDEIPFDIVEVEENE